jgi:hypothetical protein
MAHSTKNLLAVLLLITMIISVIGTLAAISALIPRQPAPVVKDLSQASGKVSVYLEEHPVESTGKVTLYLEDGG